MTKFQTSPNSERLQTTKYVTEKSKFVLGWVQKVVGKEENAGYQPFSPFPKMFSEGSFYRVVKSWDCVVKKQLVQFFL